MTQPMGHGFAPALTTFVGRTGAVDQVAGLLEEFRLVTVTGPGGVGKTRLAAEVARKVAGRFADGVWLVELAAVKEPARVPAAIAAALGVREQPGVPVTELLAEVLTRQQVLLVADNCEHVARAVAGLFGALLPAADDVRVLATSRELLGVAGEARYRLPPLALPASDDAGEIARSEAVVLFADRARRVDPQFTLDGGPGLAAARLVARLDGMPLAIELAAARVEALGLAQLLDRLDERFALLARTDHAPVAARHRSLAATAEWSYQLLSEAERRVFRRVSVFPARFTMDAAEEVAGPDAGPVVLRLVDCSLLAPPRAGADGRSRYLMLETLRGYGLDRLAEAGELDGASAALARYALTVAERAAAGLQTSSGEPAAARWLDSEDAITRHALAWATGHDPGTALRLAVVLAPWWRLRGRMADGQRWLQAAAGHAPQGTDGWCAAQYWLGQAAMTLGDFTAALGHFTAVRDAFSGREPSPVLADCLAGRCVAESNLGRLPQAIEDGRRALDAARQLDYPAGQSAALTNLAITTYYAGDIGDAVGWARQAQQIDPEALPGAKARISGNVLALVLTAAGDLRAAEQCCTNTLRRCREAGDLQAEAALLTLLGHLDLDLGRVSDAAAHLRESLRVATRIGEQTELFNGLDNCGHLCAATGRWADAVTLWAALAAHTERAGTPDPVEDVLRRQEPLQQAAKALGPDQIREAEQRGAAMTLVTAAEFAVMLATDLSALREPAGTGQLSRRERELVCLVAQGRTDAQIAGLLFISVNTVRSHLDRIRDKTGCHRRADLTRLALRAGLV
jgi:predicted ATPase/DNA-binding CsgD family transcriptional regulator